MNSPHGSHGSDPADLQDPLELPGDPRAELIHRIASSSGFARAPKLQALFLDVMRNGLAGRDDQLTEVKIGNRVFGRPAGYQPSDDTIVRAQMRLLRGKLEAYFAEEGRGEPLLVTIPKGSYVPRFESRETEAAPPAPVRPDVVSISAPPRPRKPYLLLLTPLALAAVFTLGWLSARESAPAGLITKSSPHPILSRLFDRSHPTVVIIQDISLLLLNNEFDTNFQPEDIQSGRYKDRVHDPGLDPERSRMLRFIDERAFTTVADLNITRYLQRILPEFAEQMQIVYPRHLHMRQFKESNVIIIGGGLANPWAHLVENRLKFRLIREDPRAWKLSLQNLEPRPGEEAIYRPGEYVYSILAMVPKTGGDTTVMLMAGTSTEGTEAAAEFAMRPASAKSLQERLDREAGPKGFTSFQAIIRSARVGGTSAASEILALRVE